MKISGPGRATPAGVAARPSAPAAGFSAAATTATATTAATARSGAVGRLGSVEALLALQETESPADRRRKAIKRGGRLLDLLDEVKLGLLGGEDTTESLGKLAAAVRDQQQEVDDPAVEALLRQIEARAAVELAKAEMSRLAA